MQYIQKKNGGHEEYVRLEKTDSPRPTCAHSGGVGGLLVGGALSLPDCTSPPNRPDGADKGHFCQFGDTIPPAVITCQNTG